MRRFFDPHLWRAEALRLRRQPLAWIALGTLLAVLLATATAAGLETRTWRTAALAQDALLDARLRDAIQEFRAGPPPGPAAATATYQLGRRDLGLTRMDVGEGLALGVQRLAVLPARLKATLDSRHVDAQSPGPLRNPLLADTGLPGLPAMVALLLPLVALVLCTGLLQDEREQGRLGLLRVQARPGLMPLVVAALGWRFIALVAVAVLGSLPAFALDPGATWTAAASWSAALLLFCAVWVALAGLLSGLPTSAATSLLAALSLWLTLTFLVPAGLIWGAQHQAPMPSRLGAIVQIREAQQHSEVHEGELARDWYARHPDVPAHLPAVWPASFVPRVLAQDLALRPLMRRFDDSREQQAAWVARHAWASPGLALVLAGERLAGTDTASHVRYLRQVDAFEDRWRDFFVPRVMSLQGATADDLTRLPRFGTPR